MTIREDWLTGFLCGVLSATVIAFLITVYLAITR